MWGKGRLWQGPAAGERACARDLELVEARGEGLMHVRVVARIEEQLACALLDALGHRLDQRAHEGFLSAGAANGAEHARRLLGQGALLASVAVVREVVHLSAPRTREQEQSQTHRRGALRGCQRESQEQTQTHRRVSAALTGARVHTAPSLDGSCHSPCPLGSSGPQS